MDSAIYGTNKILLTTVKLNDSILAVANNNIIIYVNAGNLKSWNGQGLLSKPDLVPPSLSRLVTVTLGEFNRLYIVPTHTIIYTGAESLIVNGDNTSNYFSPMFSQSSTSYKGMPTASFFNAGYPVINTKYILAPFEADYDNDMVTFGLITVDTTRHYLSIASTRNIEAFSAPPAKFANSVYYSFACFNKFFVYYQSQFFRVDTLGNVKSFGYSPNGELTGGNVSNMFIAGNYLFALSAGTFFISKDEGETWSVFLKPENSQGYSLLNHINVGNELYATYNSQLWRVTLSDSTLHYQELDNDGLETNQITSINKCGKYVFVATSSGLFYRDTTTFHTAKK